MNQTPYTSLIAVLLYGAMTAPLWLDRQATDERQPTISAAAVPQQSADPTPSLSPEPAPTSTKTNTRLACGVGIISRLRNRGDRCVEVPQPYAYPVPQACPPYAYTQPCVPVEPCVPVQPVCPTPVYPAPAAPTYAQPAPAPTIPTQPMVTEPAPAPAASQPAVPYVESGGALRGDCNCQECCKEFRLIRWRVVPVQKEVTEEYVDSVTETSSFCDSKCEQGDCIETIGIQNRKSHVVVQKPRVFTVTELQQETVIEKRCVKCGCIKETRVVPGSTYSPPAYGTQKPVVEDEGDDEATDEDADRQPPTSESRMQRELPIRLRQSNLRLNGAR